MKGRIGIRKESIDLTERRVPLTPQQVKNLNQNYNIDVWIERASNRHFRPKDYDMSGAVFNEKLLDCNIIFGVKEIPVEELKKNQAYCFFSHTIKGQSYNMPLLKRILELNATLIDYEKITGDDGMRLIFFGKYAGYAGMIDSLWIYGQRLAAEGINNPFEQIKQTNKYQSLDEAKEAIKKAGDEIKNKGFNDSISPLVIAVTGIGKVSAGAQEIVDLLPVKEITPQELLSLNKDNNEVNKNIYKVIIDVEDFVKQHDPKAKFDFTDYLNHPEKYFGDFEKYLPLLSILVNGIYWDERYPKLVTKKMLKELYEKQSKPNLRVISDITCDIGDSIECNVKATSSDNPVYVYEPLSEKVFDGIKGNGPVVLAVDKLPSELPVEASTNFGKALLPFIPALANAEFDVLFNKLKIPAEIKRAVIAHQGQLTPDYKYLEEYLK
ncbi:MAG: hypothetical protein K8R79_09145 [Calditrichales bacterium]|nr:hypothetical protein [Calditrichales bacterium]